MNLARAINREPKLVSTRSSELIDACNEYESVPDASRNASLYLPPLKQLLGLSPDFDELLCDHGGLDRTPLIRALARTQKVLVFERERLRLVDCGVRTLVDCHGGPTQVLIEWNLQRRVASESQSGSEARMNFFNEQHVLATINRWIFWGMSEPLITALSDQERRVLRSHFEKAGNENARGRLSEQRVPYARSWTVNNSILSIRGLTQALDESDAAAVEHELTHVNEYLLDRIAGLSTESDGRSSYDRPQKNLQQRNAERLIRVALILEWRRCGLVRQAAIGILRCFGGHQRLRMEAVLTQDARDETILDSQVKKIIERLVEQVARRLASAGSEFPSRPKDDRQPAAAAKGQRATETRNESDPGAARFIIR